MGILQYNIAQGSTTIHNAAQKYNTINGKAKTAG